MQRAEPAATGRWHAPALRLGAAGPRPARGAVAWLALLAFLFLLAVGLRGTPAFRVLVGEDGVYEWLQAACLAAAGVLAVRAARRAGRGRRRLALAAVAVAALVVVGEELAWGTRLLNLSLEQVQAANHQDEVTLHNLGFGLEASFLGMAAVSAVLAGWQAVSRNLELACWFAVPALYGAVRLLAGAGSYEAAKMSEVAELAFAVGALRLVWLHARPRPSS